jgi:hypothetical protein
LIVWLMIESRTARAPAGSTDAPAGGTVARNVDELEPSFAVGQRQACERRQNFDGLRGYAVVV